MKERITLGEKEYEGREGGEATRQRKNVERKRKRQKGRLERGFRFRKIEERLRRKEQGIGS